MDIKSLINSLTELGAVWGMRIIGVVVAFIVAKMFAGWASAQLKKNLESRNFDPTLTKFFSDLLRWAILAAVIVGLLGVFGIQTTTFAALFAAAGLAVGMALQGTLGNFAAGVMLLVFRPFKIGQVIKVAGEVGSVSEIALFTTSLITPDNRLIIIPNGKVFGNKIENITHFDTRRVDVSVGTDYGADLKQTREVLVKSIAGIEQILDDPAPQIFLAELGGSSIDWKVRVWCNTPDYWVVFEQVTQAVKLALDDAQIGIPFPQMDVHLDQEAMKALASN